jgi:thiol-disulfide isomerase/thioredoxin
MLKWAQRVLFTLAAGTLGLTLSSATAAQEASKSSLQTSPQPQDTLADNSAQPEQPMSLGDLARLARANKQNEAKSARVIDDDNLPRNGGGINVVGSPTGGSSAGPSSSGSRAEKVVLLDFWASWCGPCRESIPDLKALQRTYGRDQLEVISVNEDKDENAGRSFAADNGMNWNVQFDPRGETAREHGVSAFPTFILINAEGHEVQRFVGEDSNEPLANRLGPYLNLNLNKDLKGSS